MANPTISVKSHQQINDLSISGWWNTILNPLFLTNFSCFLIHHDTSIFIMFNPKLPKFWWFHQMKSPENDILLGRSQSSAPQERSRAGSRGSLPPASGPRTAGATSRWTWDLRCYVIPMVKSPLFHHVKSHEIKKNIIIWPWKWPLK